MIRIRVQRACALGQRQVDAPHLLATKFVEQIPTFVAEGFVRYRLHLKAAVRVQGQKCAPIEIDRIDRPTIGCQKQWILLEASLDRVAVRTVGESCDRHKSPTREICLRSEERSVGNEERSR